MRVFADPNTPMPEVHLLSNGSYHVMATHAGGGYSSWRELAVTRWREDATADCWGTFIYLRDRDTGNYWSSAYQPTRSRADHYEAIFVQATNRIFGVVFWFIILGPVGAWLFRLSDLLRQRLAFETARGLQDMGGALAAVETAHGVLVWVPARLSAIGYAFGGSFDDALNGWRSYELRENLPFHRSNDEIVARVGKAAMTGVLAEPSNSSAAARNAMRLVTRTLFIWVTVIAAMTLFGWAV